MTKHGAMGGVLLVLVACDGGTADTAFSTSDGAAASATPDAATTELDASAPPFDAGRDAAPERAPARPKVTLAPALEDSLGCDNAELAFDFDLKPRDFTIDHAFWMMWFAERSFFSEHLEIQDELAALGFDRYQAFDDPSTGLQLYVAGSRDAVIVAFRGSQELNDWLGDFNFPEDDGALHGVQGRVHRGFASALSPRFEDIRKTVSAFASAGQPVWVTGHSLGGAEATLLAARLARAGTPMGPLYTFGAPRAGDGMFASDAYEALHRRVYRIVNERDIVPRLPPAAVAADEAARVLPLLQSNAADYVRALDYRHLGQMLWFFQAEGTDVMQLPAMSDDEDKSYWAEAGKGGSFGLIAGSKEQGARHAQQRYLCRLYALRLASM